MNRKIIFILVVALIGLCSFSSPKQVRLMNYNVHNGIGLDDTTDLSRISQLINQYSPDVVALQELDSVTKRNNGIYALGLIAEQTSMHPTFGAAIDYNGGKYGIGILSKEIPISQKTIPLPGREEERVLLIVEFENFIICCTHFSLTEEDQLKSVDIIYKALSKIDKPLILMGDMNSEPNSSVQSKMIDGFITLNNIKENTFPSNAPERCIDYIYQFKNSNTIKLLNSEVINNCLFSDHLPMFVDVEF